ncbi:hypothetical protein ACNFIA_21370 [Pseudomonas sp. NY15437]|uniref:hypothetical protein n=1 Tax=Pseudomonas sp. NY15437 TaxID=3400360 RepID=UPI003A8863F6
MKINIAHIGSAEWFNFKAEIIYGLYHSLLKLGHDVTMTQNQFTNGVHNLVIGADWLTDAAHLQSIRETGVEYSIYEVERFDGHTINGRPGFNIDNYLELLQRSRFICTPYWSNLSAYASRGLGDKIVYAPWGFYPQLIDSNIRRDAPRQFDAVFFGLLKGVRAEKVNQLAAVPGMRLKTVGASDPHLMRGYYLSAARYGLSLSAGDDEAFVNPFRIYLMVANGVPVLADNRNDDDGYLDFTARGSIDDIVEFFMDPQSEFVVHASLEDGRWLSESLAEVF